MLICRRDLNTIIKVMDKFDLNESSSAVTINYNDHPGGYDLSVSFTHLLKDCVCNIDIVIDQDTLSEEVEK